VVDWLVMMRRLPSDRTLQHLIKTRAIVDSEIASLCATLRDFYARAHRVPVTPAGYLRAFEEHIDEHLAALSTPAYRMPRAAIDAAGGALRRLLERTRGGLLARAEAGCIVDGHGDLRPEHIYLLPEGPRVLDGLEFAARLRALDPIDELSFLALECAQIAGAEVGSAILARCAAGLGCPADARLVAFYTAFRAVLRARLALSHLADDPHADADKWRARATSYLESALNAAAGVKR
jgi:aminoglycoside phosphotransferase family enzyme